MGVGIQGCLYFLMSQPFRYEKWGTTEMDQVTSVTVTQIVNSDSLNTSRLTGSSDTVIDVTLRKRKYSVLIHKSVNGIYIVP